MSERAAGSGDGYVVGRLGLAKKSARAATRQACNSKRQSKQQKRQNGEPSRPYAGDCGGPALGSRNARGRNAAKPQVMLGLGRKDAVVFAVSTEFLEQLTGNRIHLLTEQVQ